MSADEPIGLPSCSPTARMFPNSWKDFYYREKFDQSLFGYVCPGCKGLFRGPAGVKMLRGDHIFPFARGGPTIWKNYQLLCSPCNIRKGCAVEELRGKDWVDIGY